ncbi:dihydrofolate reductase family protein [Pengzhenrongella sp.]|jgi:dihydrofolate reductase|uniref:dihydrofolate reductase family protein n=1 Tax=Pengzhenrongella sp. TaxID=2888820 RepID=UPI002F95E532
MSVTLDGVMQAPGRSDEDVRGGFTHGGWAVPFNDAVMAQKMGVGMAQTGAMLFGRRTYEDFIGAWAHRTDGNPFTEMMNNVQKYVASSTLAEPLPWMNSTLLAGDAADAVAGLKKEEGRDIAVIGSGDLVRSLAARALVDQYTLLIHPLVLGSGRRLFPDGAPPASLHLIDSVATGTGVIIATYTAG